MKLSRIQIRNFRCIEALELSPRSYTSLIGPNNAGKSSTLRAIDIFLNQTKPALDEWRKGHEAEPIEIEAEFDELLEWEKAKPGVSSLVHDGRIKLRLRVLPPDEAAGRRKLETVYECMKPQEEIKGFTETWTDLAADFKAEAQTLGMDGRKWKTGANREQVRAVVRQKFSHLVTTGPMQWTSEGISIDSALQQALPQAQVIPAIRDAADDASPGAKTSFGLLLESIIMPAVAASEEYKALMKAVADLERKLKGDGAEQLPAVQRLADSISAKLSDLITAKVSLGMDPPDADKFIGSNTVLRLDDGTATRIQLQGHGLQRALVFAMLEVLAAQRAVGETIEGQPPQTRRTVLLFEEPELFMHPHLMRRLKDVLTKIGKRPDWQVIVTTHSPFLVDIADDRCSLVIHRRPSPAAPPTVTQLLDDPLAGDGLKEERERLRAVLDFHPTVCEAFFARNVVLVEGDTELAALVRQDRLYQLGGVNMDLLRDTTVVSCDGKWTIVPIARLLKAFGIPVRAIHDMDSKGKTNEELASLPGHEWHANARIAEAVGERNCYAVNDTFEDVLSTNEEKFESATDKPYRAWCRVREICEGKAHLAHVPKLKAVLDFAFGP